MIKLNEMPTSADEITIEWLTEILHRSGTLAGTAVADLTIEPLTGAGYIGLVARIKPEYDRPESNGPASLIFKYSAPDPEFRQGLQGFYEREVRFYKELSEQVSLTTPHCYHAHFDAETGHSVLLLEDLAHLRQTTMVEGCSADDVVAVVKQLAQHHAQWWEDPALKEIDFLVPVNGMTAEGQTWFQECWHNYEDRLAQAKPDCYLPASFLDLGYRAAQQMMSIQEELATAPSTFIHKDTHLDNILFAANANDASVTFIDWQCCGYGPGVSDITYFMIWSVPVALRRQIEREMVQTYHQTLVANGVTDYTFDRCWRDYRLSFFRAFIASVFWAAIADTSRPHAQSMIMPSISRLTSFAEDLCVSEFLAL